MSNPAQTENYLAQNTTIDVSKSMSWTDQMTGVAYPPNDIFQCVKTDKYPTQESISLNNDDKTNNDNSQQKPVITNGNPFNKDYGGVIRSTSTVVHVGSDSNSKSLNLIEFPSENSDSSSHNGSASNTKVVTASSSQSSSIQIIKPSLSRQVITVYVI